MPLDVPERDARHASELAELTQRDKIAFVEALLNPPAPNERLCIAAARYARVLSRLSQGSSAQVEISGPVNFAGVKTH